MIQQQFNTEFTFALYTPYLCTYSTDEVTRRLYKYTLRRKNTKKKLRPLYENSDALLTFDELDNMTKTVLKNYAEKLSVSGDFNIISSEIMNLRKSGFDIIVGLPLIDRMNQMISLKEACLRANGLLAFTLH